MVSPTTAVMVPVTDFLTGVLSALVIYFVLRPFLEPTQKPVMSPAVVTEAVPAEG